MTGGQPDAPGLDAQAFEVKALGEQFVGCDGVLMVALLLTRLGIVPAGSRHLAADFVLYEYVT
jgi:hypothetical protein